LLVNQKTKQGLNLNGLGVRSFSQQCFIDFYVYRFYDEAQFISIANKDKGFQQKIKKETPP
jgi:hypothetical protein